MAVVWLTGWRAQLSHRICWRQFILVSEESQLSGMSLLLFLWRTQCFVLNDGALWMDLCHEPVFGPFGDYLIRCSLTLMLLHPLSTCFSRVLAHVSALQIPGSVRLQAPEGWRAWTSKRGDVPGDREVSGRMVQRDVSENGRLRCLPRKLRHARVQVSELWRHLWRVEDDVDMNQSHARRTEALQVY